MRFHKSSVKNSIKLDMGQSNDGYVNRFLFNLAYQNKAGFCVLHYVVRMELVRQQNLLGQISSRLFRLP